eukprot:jgi/Tetstr1/424646/TSEL_015168.t1
MDVHQRGSISAEDFRDGCAALREALAGTATDSGALEWRTAPGISAGYLSLERVLPLPAEHEDSASANGVGDMNTEVAPDEETVVARPKGRCLIDYHIVHNAMYGCPVLLCRGRRLDGNLLNRQALLGVLPWRQVTSESLSAETPEEPAHFLEPQEHPHLQQPWFMLNPCMTVERMGLMLAGGGKQGSAALRYMVAWLSLVGPVSGLCDASALRALDSMARD